MLPHLFFASLFQNNRSVFDRFVVGHMDLEEWWSHIPLDDPRFMGHPAKRMSKSKLIPLRIHGGGAPIGKGKKRIFDVVS